MEVHIYSVKAKSQAVNICVKDIRKKAKAKRKSARDLKNLFYHKIQQRATSPGKSTARVTYLSMRIHCLWVAATLLSGSTIGTAVT